jgi:oligoendopeptidase F
MSAKYPRRFVPVELDPSEWSQIEPLADNLRQRDLQDLAAAERFLLDFSELTSVIDEFGTRRYIEKSCHTEDESIEKAFLHYVENIEPKLKQLTFDLQRKFCGSSIASDLAAREGRYAMLLRSWKAEVDLFREENVPLETECTRIVADYDKVCGAMMVTFDGKELTLQQLATYLESNNPGVRQESWKLGTARRLRDRSRIDELFERIVRVDGQIAANAGCSNFMEWSWKSLKRFDYTPEDCARFAHSIERCVVPCVEELNRSRARAMGIPAPRPWDLKCDVFEREQLRPFDPSDVDGFVSRTARIFGRLSPQLAAQFESLRAHGDLDLGSRRGKQPGGYQSTLNESRRPFIFMNAAGTHGDVETLLHEGGHAFHAIASAEEPLVFLRRAPIEFCEVASMSMELFAEPHLDEFYPNPEDANRARRAHLEGILRFFPWMAVIDQFQHWLYTTPSPPTGAERDRKWVELHSRFDRGVDWTGLEDARQALWQRQMHLFHVPFYYVEYGIAQLGALQLWLKSRTDPAGALAAYRAALRLGGTRPLPELFAAAGIVFDFSLRTLEPLVNAVREELEQLPS